MSEPPPPPRTHSNPLTLTLKHPSVFFSTFCGARAQKFARGECRQRPPGHMGCVMSTALGCMLCNHKCSISSLASTFAFFPPNPPSYTVETGTDGECHPSFTNAEMDAAVRTLPPTANKVKASVHKLTTRKKESVVLFHFTCPGAQHTLLWSHGNAMDVGEMYFFFIQLADRLQVHAAARHDQCPRLRDLCPDCALTPRPLAPRPLTTPLRHAVTAGERRRVRLQRLRRLHRHPHRGQRLCRRPRSSRLSRGHRGALHILYVYTHTRMHTYSRPLAPDPCPTTSHLPPWPT